MYRTFFYLILGYAWIFAVYYHIFVNKTAVKEPAEKIKGFAIDRLQKTKKPVNTHHNILWQTARLEHELGLMPHSSEAIKEACTPCKVVRPKKMASGGTKPALQKDSTGRYIGYNEDINVFVWGQTEPVHRIKTKIQPVDNEAFDENEPLDDQIRNSI